MQFGYFCLHMVSGTATPVVPSSAKAPADCTEQLEQIKPESECPSQLHDLISRCIDPVSSDRPTMKEAIQVLTNVIHELIVATHQGSDDDDPVTPSGTPSVTPGTKSSST